MKKDVADLKVEGEAFKKSFDSLKNDLATTNAKVNDLEAAKHYILDTMAIMATGGRSLKDSHNILKALSANLTQFCNAYKHGFAISLAG